MDNNPKLCGYPSKDWTHILTEQDKFQNWVGLLSGLLKRRQQSDGGARQVRLIKDLTIFGLIRLDIDTVILDLLRLVSQL